LLVENESKAKQSKQGEAVKKGITAFGKGDIQLATL
jgi:hypothetical protein